MGLAGEAPKRVRGRACNCDGWLAASVRQLCDVCKRQSVVGAKDQYVTAWQPGKRAAC